MIDKVLLAAAIAASVGRSPIQSVMAGPDTRALVNSVTKAMANACPEPMCVVEVPAKLESKKLWKVVAYIRDSFGYDVDVLVDGNLRVLAVYDCWDCQHINLIRVDKGL